MQTTIKVSRNLQFRGLLTAPMSERRPRLRSPTSSRSGRSGDKQGEQGMVRQASLSGVHRAPECRPQPGHLPLRPFPGARNTQ
eukprot:3081014-Pyramimonas_sp.AAC.1